jgi:alkylation response protein AidB-like acyl-CoA dehydrogenase
MRFDLTDDQRAIREAVRGLAATHSDPAAVRRYAAGEDDLAALWRELGRAGWTGIAVAEADGGHGLGMVELSLACEELGRALAPGAYLGNAAAALLVGGAGSTRQR